MSSNDRPYPVAVSKKPIKPPGFGKLIWFVSALARTGKLHNSEEIGRLAKQISKGKLELIPELRIKLHLQGVTVTQDIILALNTLIPPVENMADMQEADRMLQDQTVLESGGGASAGRKQALPPTPNESLPEIVRRDNLSIPWCAMPEGAMEILRLLQDKGSMNREQIKDELEYGYEKMNDMLDKLFCRGLAAYSWGGSYYNAALKFIPPTADSTVIAEFHQNNYIISKSRHKSFAAENKIVQFRFSKSLSHSRIQTFEIFHSSDDCWVKRTGTKLFEKFFAKYKQLSDKRGKVISMQHYSSDSYFNIDRITKVFTREHYERAKKQIDVAKLVALL